MSLPFLLEQLIDAVHAGRMTDAEPIVHMLKEQMAASPTIVVPPDTLVACAKCHDTAAPEYRLRRVMGRYILLCFRNGEGCWERSPRPTCNFQDAQGIPCGLPAEARVAYGQDQVAYDDVCALHVGPCLTPAHGKITVYPLEV